MLFLLLAALCELLGCYIVWQVVRVGQSPWWLGAAVPLLLVFAWALTRSPALFAGRAFAAYAGVYLLGAMGWFMLLDGGRIDRWDLIGAGLSLTGALVILYAPRAG